MLSPEAQCAVMLEIFKLSAALHWIGIRMELLNARSDRFLQRLGTWYEAQNTATPKAP